MIPFSKSVIHRTGCLIKAIEIADCTIFFCVANKVLLDVIAVGVADDDTKGLKVHLEDISLGKQKKKKKRTV